MAALAVSLATAADATPTLVGGTFAPTGINGLVVDGTIYNVTFSTTTLNTFTAGTTLSVDAATALKDALNTLGVIAFFTGEESDDLIDVDNSLVNFDAAFRCVSCQTPWAELGGQNVLNLGFNQGALYTEAADFTEVGTVGVPEPITLSLFGAGLVGAIVMRRRKRNVT